MTEEDTGNSPTIGDNSRTSDTTELNQPPEGDDNKGTEGEGEDTGSTASDESGDDKDKGDDKDGDKGKGDDKGSLTGLSDKDLTALPEKKDNEKKPNAAIDQRIFNEKGEFDKELAKEVFQEFSDKEERWNKRVNDMRRMVSQKDDFVKNKDDFFGSYVPNKEYLYLFEDGLDETIKTSMKGWTDKLSDKYFEVGLNKKQADEMSHTFLELAKDMKAIDTRSNEQVEIDNGKWLKEQEKNLGANAKGIIKESANWILNNPRFSEKTKSELIKQMDDRGAEFISVMYEASQNHGSGNNTGNIPINVSNLGGLKTDSELAVEYNDSKTSEARCEEIIKQRHAAGRSGKLMDSLA